MGTTPTRRSETADEATYLDLAGEAMLAGMTREEVIAQLTSRIRRDQGYLAYRKASGRRTRYDDQVTSDLRALALAAALLGELGTNRAHPGSEVRQGQKSSPRSVAHVVTPEEEFPTLGDLEDGLRPVGRAEEPYRARLKAR